ncbi:MAG: hypothetical protein PHP73_05570 [Candidatus Omnitrophica bacterium]|nr:hypothetical protein [Candidatus Omnitrophota bacterium]
MSRRLRYLTIFILIFLFLQFYKFIRIRVANLDLPKGKIIFSSPIDSDNEIYVMNIIGSGLKQLTHNVATKTCIATDNEASFSQDGKKIVFRSSRAEKQNYRIIANANGRIIGEEFSGGSTDIYIMDSDGKNQIPLTYNTLSSQPFFSPDAKKIVFDSLLADNHNLKKMINIDGNGERILNFGGGQVEFSSDGEKMFDNFQYDISVMNISGINKKRITHLNDHNQPKLGMGFAISPDNKKLAVITSETGEVYRSGVVDDFYKIFEFYVMNADGSNLEKIYRIDGSVSDRFCGNDALKSRTGTIRQFKFSPDGKYIIFYADFIYKQGIYLLNPEDRSVINLTGEKENWDEILDFTFTPDGKRIVLIADIYPKNYYLHAVIIRNIKAYINYFLFRKSTPYYDNKYICIMDINGKNFRKIAKLPIGTELGRDFIHWKK